jgi:predicted amidohydrolase YtcJ
MNKLVLFFAITAFFFACQNTPKSVIADQIFTNGNFFTGDSTQLHATTVAVREERIIYVGDAAGAAIFDSKSTQKIDLGGQFTMPGFIEGHGHFSALGRSLVNLNLTKTTNWAQIVAAVAEKTKNLPADEWLEGRGWHQEKWTESAGATTNGYPVNDLLNAISDKNPVVLYHASGHGLIANARAMSLAGISRETPDPVGGRIVRDASGRAIGMFEENAMDLIDRPFSEWKAKQTPEARRAAWDNAIQLAENQCLTNGITSFQDAGSGFEELDWYEDLAKKKELSLRLWVMISAPTEAETGRLANFPKIGLGGNFLTIRAVKGYFDGALGSFGAWLLEDYADKHHHKGQNTTKTEEIARLAAACDQHKLQFCVHAIGDRANQELLNIYEKYTPNRGLRWRVEHAQHLDIQDITRFKPLGVIASMQALHCTSDAPFVVKRLGFERAKTGAYAWRSLLDSGAHLANGTDAPVEEVNPLPCIFAACTRRRADAPPMAFFTEQKMTRVEALASYTRWNAWAAFEEAEKGTISVGKLADFVVLSRNLESCSDDEILTTSVLKTIVGGKVLFEKK